MLTNALARSRINEH